jgi:ubiquinone/menaquinone biosynthesis C-methylase UbiE
MTFSDVEQSVLAAVWSHAQHKEELDELALARGLELLNEYPELLQCRAGPEDWTNALSNLVESGVFVHTDGTYLLAEDWQVYASQCAKEQGARFWENTLLRAESSPAYRTFCERVYGKDLCQIGYATMAQLERLLAVLDLDERNHVLDIGCGIGPITEHISAVTQATVTGIDYAPGLIKRARERTAGKQARLDFRVGDMDDLIFPANSFDTIISIDTLYFCADVPTTLLKMKQMLRPGGQMGILYTESVKPRESRERLEPGKTRIGAALNWVGLRFRSWDLTLEDQTFWDLYVKTVEELEPAFKAEGNAELCKVLDSTGQGMRKATQDDRVRRYLYHAYP